MKIKSIKKLLPTFIFSLVCANSTLAFEKPVLLAEQGSFFAGGSVLQSEGAFDYDNPMNTAGQTLHGDHAYVFYQKPVNAHKYSLVFLHGAGQSGKTWESTPDGRDGFQNIFLERGYSTYVLDQPRRGKAGQSTVSVSITPATVDQMWFTNFRVGDYPKYFDGVQFAKDKNTLNQYLRQMTPNTGAYDANVISDAIVDVFNKSGKGILVTHSQGGGPGWLTAIKTNKVKGIVAYEPGSAFVFPPGEVPEAELTSSPFGKLYGVEITLADFKKLTKIPIIIYYGDYISNKLSDEWNKDSWRIRLNMARKWVEVVNKYGGDAKVVHLPEVGIKGNTHFPFSDLNNVAIANLMEAWLQEKGLSK